MATPVTYNPYVSQYVPAPVQEYQQAASYFQREYDENLLASEKLKTMLGSVKALPQHKAVVAQQLKQYEDKLGEIAQSGDYENAALKVRNTATDFATNYQSGELGQAVSSYQNYQTYLADKQKLGNEYAEYNDPFLPYRSQALTKDGKINPFNYGGMGKREDHYKKADEVIGKIADDETIRSGMVPNADGTGFVFSSTKDGGVSKQKVLDVAARKAPAFMGTIEGRDFLKSRAYAIGRALSPQEQYDAAREYLTEAAYNQIGVKHGEEQKLQFLPTYLLKKQDEENAIEAPTTSYTSATGNAAANQVADEVADYDFDDNGELVKINRARPAGEEYNSNAALSSIGGGMSQTHMTRDGKVVMNSQADVRTPITSDDAIGQNLKGVIEQLRKNQRSNFTVKGMNPTPDGAKNYSNKELLERWRTALKNHENVYVPGKDFTPEAQKLKTEQLAPTGDPLDLFEGRQVVLLGPKESGGGVPGKGIADLMESNREVSDLLHDKNTTIKVKNRSVANPYGMPGAYEVVVTNHGNGKGEVKTKKFLVQASDEESAAMDIPAKVGNAAFSGAPQTNIDYSVDAAGNKTYLRVVNTPVGEGSSVKFLQRVETRMKRASKNGMEGADILLRADDLKPALEQLYQHDASPKLKRFRLTSTGQSIEKGVSTNEDDEQPE